MIKTLRQGDIVLIPFPFTDLNEIKIRPALVVSNKTLKSRDIILCCITSQKSKKHEVTLTNKDLLYGELPVTSYIRAGKIITLEKSLIQKTVARINTEKMKNVIGELMEIIK